MNDATITVKMIHTADDMRATAELQMIAREDESYEYLLGLGMGHCLRSLSLWNSFLPLAHAVIDLCDSGKAEKEQMHVDELEAFIVAASKFIEVFEKRGATQP